MDCKWTTEIVALMFQVIDKCYDSGPLRAAVVQCMARDGGFRSFFKVFLETKENRKNEVGDGACKSFFHNDLLWKNS